MPQLVLDGATAPRSCHARGITMEAPIAVDDIIEKHLKIEVEFAGPPACSDHRRCIIICRKRTRRRLAMRHGGLFPRANSFGTLLAIVERRRDLTRRGEAHEAAAAHSAFQRQPLPSTQLPSGHTAIGAVDHSLAMLFARQ